MIRITLLLLLLISALNSHAGLPSAGFDQTSLDGIEEAWGQNQGRFELEAAQQQAGTPEASYVLGRYLVAAFEGAGYSLDETLHTYITTAGPGQTQMHVFVQTLGLGSVIVQLSTPELANAYLQAGAVSQRTLNDISRRDPKAAITEPDYIIEGSTNPFEIQHDARQGAYRQVGRIVFGQVDWEGWIIFSEGHIADTVSGIGIAEISKMTDGEQSILVPLAESQQLLKIEADYVRNPGADTFLNRSKDIRIQLTQ